MQDIKIICTLDGAEYKEYQLVINEQPIGVISWKSQHDASEGRWYTIASDGKPKYFYTQEEVIEFLRDNPFKSANELSAKLKAEAHKLVVIAEEIEAKTADFEAGNS